MTELAEQRNTSLDLQITFGHTIYRVSTMRLGTVLGLIKNSNGQRQKIARLRRLPPEEQQQYKKENLPYFNLGLFNGERKKECLIKSSGLVLDIDKISWEQLEWLQCQLYQDANVFSFFVSPGGSGLKVLYLFDEEITDHETFKKVYKAWVHNFTLKYRINPDAKTFDVSRACFLSDDRELYLNEQTVPISVEDALEVYKQIEPSTLPQAYECRNVNMDTLAEAVDFLIETNNKGIDIYNNYQEWQTLGLALASLGEQGREHFIKLSLANNKYKDSEEALHKEYDKLLRYYGKGCEVAVTIRSLFAEARRHGFVATRQCFSVIDALKDNEDGDARLLVKILDGCFAYDWSTEDWYRWIGNYWQLDATETVFLEIQKVIGLYADEATKCAKEKTRLFSEGKDSDAKIYASIEAELLKRIRSLQALTRKKHIMEIAQHCEEIAVDGNEWDRDEFLLGCANGTIDLSTGDFREGWQSDFIKTVCPTEWVGIDIEAPLFEQFLSDVFNEDTALIDYIQRLLGYAITGDTREQIFPILGGEGRNGKSTLLEILKEVLGDIAGAVQAEMLMDSGKYRSSAGPSPDIMALRGKRLAWASESNEGRKLNIGKMKLLAGIDTLVGRAMYAKHTVNFKPTHKLMLLTNNKPSVSASDYAAWQRIHLIPFNVKFVDNPRQEDERQRDPAMMQKLKREVSGILAWLVRGCLEWQHIGLLPPEAVRTATNEYQQEEDLIGHFIDEACVLGERRKMKSRPLYKGYKLWCEESGHYALSHTKFGRYLKNVCRFKTEESNYVYYLGIELNDEWMGKVNNTSNNRR